MPKTRRPESGTDRNDRLERRALTRSEDSAAEEKAIDAAVRRSIKLHGA